MKKQQFLTPPLKRKLILLAVISLLLASALEIYTFGFTPDFMSRWLRSFLVSFVLIALTVLAIVPGVNKLVNRFSKG